MKSSRFGTMLATLAGMAANTLAAEMPRFVPKAPRVYYPSKNPTGALKIQRAARKARNRKAAK